MSGDEPPALVRRPGIGLCSTCRHASVQRNARGSEFWRCRAADTNPHLLQYPPLPVLECRAFEANPSGAGEAGEGPAE